MKLENGWETSFLEVVQNSEFKKEALLSQLLCQDSEEVEELVDDDFEAEAVDFEAEAADVEDDVREGADARADGAEMK